MQNPAFRLVNRTFAVPELAAVARHMEARYPGTPTLVLDANFLLMDGFPLLPHLNHDDGRTPDRRLA